MKTKVISSREYAKHLTGYNHPESPDRALTVNEALTQTGIPLYLPSECTEEDILRCHTKEYLEKVINEIKACGSGCRELSTGDVRICRDSYKIALLAAGGALDGVKAVLKGAYDNAFCAIRPPGHHACSDKGMGFCIFNNAAIAARFAQDKCGAKKVLIADWDVHHGNGTEEIFKNDPSVFYFSTHQLDNYPGTGSAAYRGEGKGEGTTWNVPIIGRDGSRKRVIQAFENLIPAMEIYKPDFTIISAGFDGHIDDPLGGFDLTTEDFASLTAIMKKIAKRTSSGKIVSLLEGGYNLKALADSVVGHVSELTDKE